jgi:hypothetical protein
MSSVSDSCETVQAIEAEEASPSPYGEPPWVPAAASSLLRMVVNIELTSVRFRLKEEDWIVIARLAAAASRGVHVLGRQAMMWPFFLNHPARNSTSILQLRCIFNGIVLFVVWSLRLCSMLHMGIIFGTIAREKGETCLPLTLYKCCNSECLLSKRQCSSILLSNHA